MVGQKGKHRLGSFSETLALNVLRVSCIEYRRELVRHAEERRGERGDCPRETFLVIDLCGNAPLFLCNLRVHSFNRLRKYTSKASRLKNTAT